MRLIYCYDAYCGWCYGFSDVIKKINKTTNLQLPMEVISGGMLLPDYPMPISVIAATILDNYEQVEEYTGVKFGEDFLWHARNPEQSDWFPNSLTPAIALSIIKEHAPDQALEFATDIEYGLNFEGRDLTDFEAYRHLMPKYNLEFDDFSNKMNDPIFKLKAEQDFQTCKQLQVSSFPVLMLQANESKFYIISKGYTPFETVMERIDNILQQINAQLN